MPASTQKIDEFLPTTELQAGDILYGLRSGAVDLSIDIVAALKSYFSVYVGMVKPFTGRAVPSGHLFADGTAVSRSTYSALFNVLCKTIGTGTVTIASPGVWTLVGHGFTTGDSLYLTTTGALPTGLSANTLYYAVTVTDDTFRLATSRANALAGTAINTSGTQSGVHTVVDCAWGLGDGSTTFNLPDLRESVLVGTGTRGAGVTAHDTFNLGEFKDDRMQGHWHGFGYGSSAGGSTARLTASSTTATVTANTATDQIRDAITDPVNGTPRTGTTTRTKQVGVKYAVQYE